MTKTTERYPLKVRPSATDEECWDAALLCSLATGKDHKAIFLSLLQQRDRQKEEQCQLNA